MYNAFPILQPIVATYLCPNELPLSSSFSQELQDFAGQLKTLLLVDVNHAFTQYYCDIHHGIGNATAPTTDEKLLHFIICHDPDMLEQTGVYQFITPSAAESLINTIPNKGNVIRHELGAYIQVEKIKIGNTTVNITFLFGGIDTFFRYYHRDTALIEMRKNRMFFADQQTLNAAFFDHVPFESVMSVQPEHQPETKVSVNDEAQDEILESVLANMDAPAAEAEWQIFLGKMAKQKKPVRDNNSINTDSFYSVLDVVEGSNIKSFNQSKLWSNKQVASTSKQHKKTPPVIANQPYQPAASTSRSITKAISSGTKYLWSMFKPAHPPQKNQKVVELYFKSKLFTPARTSVVLSEAKDPLEKLLTNYTASVSPTDLNQSTDVPALKENIYMIKGALIAKSAMKHDTEARLNKVSMRQVEDLNKALQLVFSGILMSFFKLFLVDDNRFTREWQMFTVAMIAMLMTLFAIKYTRQPLHIKHQSDVLADVFSRAVESVKLTMDNSEAAFFRISLSLIFLKEMNASNGTTHPHQEDASLVAYMQKFTDIIPDRPHSIAASPMFAMLPLDEIIRSSMVTRTMCALLLIHNEKLPHMFLKGEIPEINIPFMETHEQVKLIEDKLHELNKLIIPQLSIKGRKLPARECENIFDLLDSIMLIYVLRNDPDQDPFFESFKNNYSDLAAYADAKIAAYVQKENNEAPLFLEITTIHQTPVKSKLFSCAWVENRPVAKAALDKMIKSNEPDQKKKLTSSFV